MASTTLGRESSNQAAITVLAEAVAERAGADALLARVCRYIAEQRGLLGVTITCLGSDGAVAALGAEPAGLLDVTRRHVQRGEGPCVEALHRGEPVVVDDLPRHGHVRWPSWARHVTAAGAVRACSEPIRLDGEVVGAAGTLGGPADRTGLDGDPGLRAVTQVAAAYAIAVSAYADAKEVTGQLQEALDSRVRIEQAKGALAASLGVGVEEAFEWLRRASRNRNRRLHEVAAEVVERFAETPALPAPGRPDGSRQAPDLRITTTPVGLRLAGAADCTSVPALRAALARFDGAGVTVDLRRLVFLDAECARLLFAAAERLPAGATLTLVAPTPDVGRVLDLLGAKRHPHLRLVRTG